MTKSNPFLDKMFVIGRNLRSTGSDRIGAEWRWEKGTAGGPGEGHRGSKMAIYDRNYGQNLAKFLAIILVTLTTLGLYVYSATRKKIKIKFWCRFQLRRPASDPKSLVVPKHCKILTLGPLNFEKSKKFSGPKPTKIQGNTATKLFAGSHYKTCISISTV